MKETLKAIAAPVEGLLQFQPSKPTVSSIGTESFMHWNQEFQLLKLEVWPAETERYLWQFTNKQTNKSSLVSFQEVNIVFTRYLHRVNTKLTSCNTRYYQTVLQQYNLLFTPFYSAGKQFANTCRHSCQHRCDADE